MIKQISIIVIFLLFCMISISYSQVDKLITFQGFLKDNVGNPVNDNVQLTFRIYDESDVQQWEEIHGSVGISDGLFRVVLGSISPLNLKFDQPYKIGITINSDPELPPTEITGVAYSYYSMETEKARNLDQMGATGGQVLKWSGTEWTPAEDLSGGTPPDGSVTTAKLADNAVTSVKITDGQVGVGDLANNAVTSAKILDGQIVNADISGTAAIAPGKISGTAWTGTNDGAGSGLDADLLDGQQASSFLSTSSDYGRPGVAPDLYEDGYTLTSLYVNEGQSSSISSAMITDGTITGADIGDNQVGSSEIASSAVGNSEIASNAVDGSKVQNSSLTSVDLLNEPGIARYKNSSGVSIPQSGTVTAASLSISVPAPGYIVVQGFCYGGISGTVHGTIGVGITNSSSEIPSSPNYIYFGSSDENLETSYYRWGNLTTERTFYASSAGTYSFYLRAWMGYANGTATVWYPSLVAMYFSTNYGTVVTTSETAKVASPNNDGSGGF